MGWPRFKGRGKPKVQKRKAQRTGWASKVGDRTERRYPARTVGQPRRAREVMSAAMRAVVRISAMAYQRVIDVECCIAQRAVQAVVPLSAGEIGRGNICTPVTNAHIIFR